jgi:hypothetical protein
MNNYISAAPGLGTSSFKQAVHWYKKHIDDARASRNRMADENDEFNSLQRLETLANLH